MMIRPTLSWLRHPYLVPLCLANDRRLWDSAFWGTTEGSKCERPAQVCYVTCINLSVGNSRSVRSCAGAFLF